MLRPDELARIRATNAAWMTHTCTITRPGGAQAAGGWPGPETTEATGVPCRVEPASSRGGQEQDAGSGITSAAPWDIVLGHDAIGIQPRDTIIVDGVGVFDVVSSTSDRGVQTDAVAACTKRDPA